MIRKYLYIILLVAISLPLYGQKQGQAGIDSMLGLLVSGKNRNVEDTNKVKLLIRISWGYSDMVNSDESIKYAQQALDISRKLNYKKGIQLSYSALGDGYSHLSDHSKAFEYYDKAMQICEEVGDNSGVAVVLGNKAALHFETGDYKTSLLYNFKALKIGEEIGSKMTIANCLNGIANIYTEQGYYPKALEYHLRALKIFEQLGKKINIAYSYLNIANIFNDEGDYNKALENYNKALKIDEEIGHKIGIAGCYISIGTVYQRMGDLPMSLVYFQKALKVPFDLENRDIVGKLMNNIGTTYFKQKNYLKATEYFQVSLNLSAEIEDREDVAINQNSLGDCFLAMIREETTSGPSKRIIMPDPEISHYATKFEIPAGKAALLRAAFDYFRQGLAMGRKINAKGIMQTSYEGLSEGYKLSNDFEHALLFADTAQMVKDSIFSKENNEKIVRLEVKHDYDQQFLADSLKHAQDIQEGNFRLQKQKIALYVSIGVFVLVILVVIILQRTKTARVKTEQQALFSRQLLEIELKALRAQMNPHFIFNSLNSIQAFILKENRADASEYLQKFSKLIRMILDNSQKTSNTIEDEVEILGLYLDLEQLRLKEKFDFEIKISGEVDPTFTEIPSMVLQPLVENSIWHGLMNLPGKGHLKVELTKEKNKLVCIVEDNGIGITRSKTLKTGKGGNYESKGLKLVEDRLQAWSKTKGLQYTFTVSDNAKQYSGTRTEITILYPPYV